MSPSVWAGMAVLVLANALYVAAEFGAVGVRRSRVRRMSDDGHAMARRLLPFVDDSKALDRYVGASQIGITVSSLMLGAFAQATFTVALAPILAGWFALAPAAALSAAVLVVLVTLTAVQVVVGELVPKALALQYPTETALATVLPMQWSLRLFRPVIAVLNGTATLILRLAGTSAQRHGHLHSPEEIDLLIAESRDGGLLEPEEQQRLRRALRLGLRKARDLMVPLGQLTMLNVDAPWDEVVLTVAGSPFSRMPVYRGTPDRIVGTLRVKDLLERYVLEGPLPLERLIRPVVSIAEDLPADRVVGMLRERRVHQAIVTDEAGRTVGMVTIQDLLNELVGAQFANPAARIDMAWLEVGLLSFAFILVNGLYVAAEFALLAAPRAAYERRAAGGDRFAERILEGLTSPVQQDRYVATAQIAITLASLGLGMFGEHELARLVEPLVGPIPVIGGAALAGGLALGVLTLGHIVFGEMVPKGIALQRADAAARVFYWPMRATLWLLYPFVLLSGVVTKLCLRLLGVRRDTQVRDETYTPEELQLIVEESRKGGALRGESGRILRELFEFGDLTAREAMVPRVRIAGIPVGATPPVVRAIVAEHRRTRYPVFEGDLDHIVGMLHVKDLLRRLLVDEPVTAADVRKIPVVPETAALDDVLATMQRASAHLAWVIDEHGGTAGIITLEDLFEEVVGELDEDTSTAPSIVPAPDGSVKAAGTVRLDELGQHFNLDLEHEDVDSVSGLVLARLGRPPRVGDTINWGRIRLEVTATRGHGVKEVRATVRPER